ncbi:MAG: hypothetical protein CMJ78_13370 [Planctomycetaceae bacterium]|nr:hypothetical protein [Planctomycetaceae bacterium]
MTLKTALFDIIDGFNSANLSYAVCGGMAVAIHGYPRATQDLDLMIPEDDLELATATLESLGFDLSAGMIPFDLDQPSERHIFRVSKAVGSALLTVDLLLVNSFLKPIWESRETHEIDGHKLCVVSRQGLGELKRIAGRLQDLADIEHLGLDDGS